MKQLIQIFFVLAIDYDTPGVGNEYEDPINYTGNDNGINDHAKDVYSKGFIPYNSTRYTAPGGKELGYIYPLPYFDSDEGGYTGVVISSLSVTRYLDSETVYISPFTTSFERDFYNNPDNNFFSIFNIQIKPQRILLILL